jgi:hypothetical protein
VRIVGRTRALAAGVMQATSFTFIVVATTIDADPESRSPDSDGTVLGLRPPGGER